MLFLSEDAVELDGNFDHLMTTGNSNATSSLPSPAVNDDNDDRNDVIVTSPADELVVTKKKTRKKRRSSKKSEEIDEEITAEQLDKGLSLVFDNVYSPRMVADNRKYIQYAIKKKTAFIKT